MDSTTTDPQVHLASTANKLALSAIIISIAAFVVTFLQLLLGNLISKEARWKVGSSAIGIMSRHKSFRLSPWGIRVFYPEVDFNILTFLSAVSDSRKHGIEFSFLRQVATRKKARWCPVTSEMVISPDVLSDGVRVLVDYDGNLLTSAILTWEEWARYMWWKCTHTVLPYDRPRATWAQIIRGFGIFDGESLVLRKLNVNTVPSSIDAPIQRVKLWDLGCLSLLMGCTDVSIDIQSRHFHATGSYCTLSTEDLPMFGKAVKFEGDIYSIHGQLAECDGASLRASLLYASGSFLYPSFTSSFQISPDQDDDPSLSGSGAFERQARKLKQLAVHPSKLETNSDIKSTVANGKPTDLPQKIPDIICQDWTQERTDSHLYNSLHETEAIVRIWQHRSNHPIPKAIAAATFALEPGVICAFPSKTLLEPLLPFCRSEAQILLDHMKSEACCETLVFPGTNELHALLEINRTGGFLPTSALAMSSSLLRSDNRSSGFSWTCGNLMQACGEFLWGVIRDQCAEVKKIAISEAGLNLLESYNPLEWANTDEKLGRTDSLAWNDMLPKNLLWLQVLTLDTQIRMRIMGNSAKLSEGPILATLWTEEMIRAKMDEGAILEDKSINDWGVKSIVRSIMKSYGNDWDMFEEMVGKGSFPRSPSDPTTSADKLEAKPLPDAYSATESKLTKGLAEKNNPIKSSQDHLGQEERNSCSTPKNNTPQIMTACACTDTQPSNPQLRDNLPEQAEETPLKPFPWDLEGSLRQHAKLTFAPAIDPDHQYHQLAILLKLRALFFIAMLMVSPDSSDVYKARKSEVKVPII